MTLNETQQEVFDYLYEECLQDKRMMAEIVSGFMDGWTQAKINQMYIDLQFEEEWEDG